jgi:thiamine biosynthesis lipoprotein
MMPPTMSGEPSPLEREWLCLLAEVQRWSRETEGAFDPVLGALVRAWGLREGGRTPSDAELAQARIASGAALLRLNLQAGTARLLQPGAAIEEGGFLKGYALDAAARVARSRGAATGLLDFGGQFLAWGRIFDVAIATPGDRRLPRLRLRLAEASLSGSGCSERGRHILDPRTGRPCPD